MTEVCQRRFDDSLLSGYVDRELTQAESQRVRLHLEECPRCRALTEDLEHIREAAMLTPFSVPTDEQWQEHPRSGTSLWARRLGWLLLLAWLTGASWLALRGLLADSAAWWEKALVVALGGGALLLLLSVLLDRLRALKTDRYRRVQK